VQRPNYEMHTTTIRTKKASPPQLEAFDILPVRLIGRVSFVLWLAYPGSMSSNLGSCLFSRICCYSRSLGR